MVHAHLAISSSSFNSDRSKTFVDEGIKKIHLTISYTDSRNEVLIIFILLV